MDFKICPNCHCSWAMREDFIKNPGINLIGYQPHFGEPEKGLFLFNHIDAQCGTTLAMQADLFTDLYSGPIYTELEKETDECGGHCLSIHDLSRCNSRCSMGHIRETMQIILSLKPTTKTQDKIKAG